MGLRSVGLSRVSKGGRWGETGASRRQWRSVFNDSDARSMGGQQMVVAASEGQEGPFVGLGSGGLVWGVGIIWALSIMGREEIRGGGSQGQSEGQEEPLGLQPPLAP